MQTSVYTMIKYTSVSLRNNAVVTDFNTIDANGDSVYAFDYGEDFMLDGVIPVSVGDTASGVVCNDTFEVRLDMVLSTPLSQDIVYSIVKKSLDSSARESIRYMDTIRVGDTIDHTFLDTVCLPILTPLGIERRSGEVVLYRHKSDGHSFGKL